MNLSRLYLLAILILVFSTFIQAQDEAEAVSSEDYNRIEATTRINEFGKIGKAERAIRIDNFLIELQNNPGATGYIIFYQGKDVLPSQYGVRAEQLYLTHLKYRRYDENRVTLINSFRERQSTELWIVPEGHFPPEPTETTEAPAIPVNKTYLYHRCDFEIVSSEFLLPSVIAERERAAANEEYSGQAGNGEEEPSIETPESLRQENDQEIFYRPAYDFAVKAKDNFGNRAVVVFYANEKLYDLKKVKAFIEQEMQRIAGETQLNFDKLEIAFGGYNEGIGMEMWVVPSGAKMPAAKPNQPEYGVR